MAQKYRSRICMENTFWLFSKVFFFFFLSLEQLIFLTFYQSQCVIGINNQHIVSLFTLKLCQRNNSSHLKLGSKVSMHIWPMTNYPFNIRPFTLGWSLWGFKECSFDMFENYSEMLFFNLIAVHWRWSLAWKVTARYSLSACRDCWSCRWAQGHTRVRHKVLFYTLSTFIFICFCSAGWAVHLHICG